MTKTCCNIETTTRPADLGDDRRDMPTYLPKADIIETRDEFFVRVDVPGARPDDIDVNLDRGILTVHARVTPREHSGQLYREFGIGDFRRSFQIGDGIDAASINAEVEHGVLTLRLPKAETARARRVVVHGKN
ncbi:MAG: hypothetical protein AMXMBFR47_01470 [Planctomycetota bacterium]